MVACDTDTPRRRVEPWTEYHAAADAVLCTLSLLDASKHGARRGSEWCCFPPSLARRSYIVMSSC